MSAFGMESTLRDLAQHLAPPQDLIDDARKCCNEIFKILKINSKFRLDRFRFVGGSAKNTSTALNMDHDLSESCSAGGACVRKCLTLLSQ